MSKTAANRAHDAESLHALIRQLSKQEQAALCVRLLHDPSLPLQILVIALRYVCDNLANEKAYQHHLEEINADLIAIGRDVITSTSADYEKLFAGYEKLFMELRRRTPKARLQDRDAEIVRLRDKGKTFGQIGKLLKLSPDAARKAHARFKARLP